jgi:5-methylcytosine-specific restriction endonuclease McrA
MDIDDDLDSQIRLGHLLLNDRKCRSCGQIKNLIESFYRTRSDRGPVPSSYSYECKDCTIKRIQTKRKIPIFNKKNEEWAYPDW